jgi:hypothetical protein
MQLTGRVYNSAGTAQAGLSVIAYDVSDDSQEGSDTTNGNGEFSITSLDDDKQYYVEVTSGSDKLILRGDIDSQYHVVCADIIHSRTATELTISSGSITITQDFHTVDTEGDGATDDLTTIVGGFDNQVLTIWPASGSRDIVIPANASPSANGIYNDTVAFTMNIAQDRAQLMFDGTLGYWILLNPRNSG